MHPSIVLNGNTLYVRKFEPFYGLKVWGDLGVKFGPALAQLGGDGGIRGAVETLFMSMPGDEQRRIFSLVVHPDYVSITQTPPDGAVKLTEQEVNRRLELTDLFDLFWFAVRVQFGPLLLRGVRRIGEALSLPADLAEKLENSVKI